MNRNDHHLVQQVLDGEVSVEAFDDFQQRLREEPELLSLYEDYVLLQHTLKEEFEGGVVAPRILRPAWRSSAVSSAVAIAAVLALLAVIMFTRPWISKSAPDDVALLTFSVDAVWRIDGASRSIGGATGVESGSVLHLDYGRAGISLSPTVRALVEGPAELTISSKDAIFLKSGKGYFTAGDRGGLKLETPGIVAADFGAEFGIEVPAEGVEEILVSNGEMRLVSKKGDGEAFLVKGDAAHVSPSGDIGRFPSDDRRFAKVLGQFRSIFSDSFESEWTGDSDKSPDLENRDAVGVRTQFLRLPEPVPGPDSSVLLTTLDVGDPSEDEETAEGLSFVSFSSKGNELLLFGDASRGGEVLPAGESANPVVVSEFPVTGVRTVTLRYDTRTGDVSLHQGGLPLGPVICSGKIPPGSNFDEIQLGALAGSALAVKSLDIRVGLE